jgi:hypothetical protein
VTNNEFVVSNNNRTIARIATKQQQHAVIRLNKELAPRKGYEWTIRLDSIYSNPQEVEHSPYTPHKVDNSRGIVVGVADFNATTHNQMYGISSSNQAYSCGQYQQQQISFS